MKPGNNVGTLELPEQSNVNDRLRSLVDRIERLAAERDDISVNIKDIYQESRSAGYNPKVMRELIRTRKIDAETIAEAETLLDVYRRAMGAT